MHKTPGLLSSFAASVSAFALAGLLAGCSSTAGAHDGTYSGRYTGDASGAVKMTVDGDSLDVVANVGGKDYSGTGELAADGSIEVGIGTANGVTTRFTGKFAGGKADGVWASSVGTQGSWSVSR